MLTIIMIIIDGLLVYYGGNIVLTALGFGGYMLAAGGFDPGISAGTIISIGIGIGMIVIGLKGIYKRTLGRKEES